MPGRLESDEGHPPPPRPTATTAVTSSTVGIPTEKKNRRRRPPPSSLPRSSTPNGNLEERGNTTTNTGNGSGENPLLKMSWKQRWGLKPTAEQLAEQQARHLKNASELLLERLFAFLSQLPEEKEIQDDNDDDNEEDDDENRKDHKNNTPSLTLNTTRGNNNNSNNINTESGSQQPINTPGITLPASAVGWLSSQLCQQELQQERKRRRGRHHRHIHNLNLHQQHHRHHHDDDVNNNNNNDDDDVEEEDEDDFDLDEASFSSFFEQQEQVLWMGVTMRDRLKLLKFLLPRATHIRLTHDVWPPLDMDNPSSHPNSLNQPTMIAMAAANGAGRGTKSGTRIDNNPNNNDMDGGGGGGGGGNDGRPFVGQDLNCSTISVDSALTTESMRPRRPTMETFLRYSHNLHHHPHIDIQRVFPNVQVLVLNGIPPTWIHNLYKVRRSLQVLRVERGSMYNVHSFLFPKVSITKHNTAKMDNPKMSSTNKNQREEDPLASPSPPDEEELGTVKPMALEEYRALSHLKLSHCGIGEVSGLLGSSNNNNNSKQMNRIKIPPPLSRLPNLVSLSLAHNELLSEHCALAGLSSLPYLTKLDLSYNCLSGLDSAYTRLGQIQILCLSNNRLTSARGIDRLYALQELLLDHNQIVDFADVVGLGRLPELTILSLHDNPLEMTNPDRYRVDVLNAFREERVRNAEELTSMTFRQLQQTLPVLDGKVASNKELIAMRERTFRASTMTIRSQQQQQQHQQPHEERTTQLLAAVGVDPTTTITTVGIAARDSPLPGVDEEIAVETNPRVGEDYAMNTSMQALERRSILSPQGPIRHRRVKRERPSRKARIGNGTGDDSNDVSAETMAKPSSLPRRRRRNHRTIDNTRKNKKHDGPSSSTMHATTMTNPASQVVVAFSVQDVLQSLSPRKTSRTVEETDKTSEEVVDDQKSEFVQPAEAVQFLRAFADAGHEPIDDQITKSTCESTEESYQGLSNGNDAASPQPSHPSINKSRAPGKEESKTDTPLDPSEISSDAKVLPGDGNDSTKEGSFSADRQGGGDLPIVENERESRETSDKELSDNGVTGNGEIKGRPPTEKTKPNGKVATVRLFPGATGTTEFDIFSQDWDDLVQRAAEGLIPDGLVRNPIAEIEKQESKRGAVFSPNATDLLAPPVSTMEAPEHNNITATNGQATLSTTSGDSQSQFSLRTQPLPELVWQDDGSVPSSLGTNRDDFPHLNKFQLAEENLEYDGPEYSRDWSVLSNIQLYFNTFVFPGDSVAPPPSSHEELPDEEQWQGAAMKYPRIQLWPEDRRRLENSSISEAGEASLDESGSCERLVRVWEEEIIPCGKPTLRRLLPNRRTRLGFHGDMLYQDGAPDTMSDCRKVILCLSSSAFYVIVGDDKVTAKTQEKKKKFPIPIGTDKKFQDGPWPHAVARHSFQDLQGITIGFGFQRLTLRFTNPALQNTDPFTYVLLTSNKMQTVSILQELQRCASYATEQESINESLISVSSQEGTLHIDNDDRGLLDAVAIAVAPDVLGVVLHYQILQQRWKHGERGSVRRVCIITDTKLFLLDEDYAGDGSKPQQVGNSHERFGNVRYRMVDEATLKQVGEVQAAGADPLAITIIINPLSKLSRTHRWRLLCRDSDGAERLVEDVRKAIEMAE